MSPPSCAPRPNSLAGALCPHRGVLALSGGACSLLKVCLNKLRDCMGVCGRKRQGRAKALPLMSECVIGKIGNGAPRQLHAEVKSTSEFCNSRFVYNVEPSQKPIKDSRGRLWIWFSATLYLSAAAGDRGTTGSPLRNRKPVGTDFVGPPTSGPVRSTMGAGSTVFRAADAAGGGMSRTDSNCAKNN